jgi:hypothetical protein
LAREPVDVASRTVGEIDPDVVDALLDSMADQSVTVDEVHEALSVLSLLLL